MSSEWELDDGIKSIKSAWRREHTARANLEKMLEQTEAENAKLREFAAHMARVLDIDGEWRDPEWCDSGCMDEFKCRPTGDQGETRFPAWARLKELGVVK